MRKGKLTEKVARSIIKNNPKDGEMVDWYCISAFHKLSEEFIREYQDKLDWYWISAFQDLSEDFIREFQDKVRWDRISYSQKLSEDFYQRI
jgi:hypothetical protein